MTWTAHFWRYCVEFWEEFDSPEDAIRFLDLGERDGSLSSRGVIWPDGTERVYDWVYDTYGTAMKADADTPTPPAGRTA